MNTDTIIIGGPVAVERRTGRTYVDGVLIPELPTAEFRLLSILAEEPSRCFSHGELLPRLPRVGTRQVLDGVASRLRRRLTEAGAGGLVVNCWGVGYRLTD